MNIFFKTCVTGMLFFWMHVVCAVRECNELKKYLCPYNDYLEDAIQCCLKNHPNDVEQCVYCTFEGEIDEIQLKKEIEKVKQKNKKKK